MEIVMENWHGFRAISIIIYNVYFVKESILITLKLIMEFHRAQF